MVTFALIAGVIIICIVCSKGCNGNSSNYSDYAPVDTDSIVAATYYDVCTDSDSIAADTTAIY